MIQKEIKVSETIQEEEKRRKKTQINKKSHALPCITSRHEPSHPDSRLAHKISKMRVMRPKLPHPAASPSAAHLPLKELINSDPGVATEPPMRYTQTSDRSKPSGPAGIDSKQSVNLFRSSITCGWWRSKPGTSEQR